MESLKILALGAGVQSTCLYYRSSMGEMERLDFAIFVDTGREKRGTYLYLETLFSWAAKNNGIPLIVVKKKNLYRDLLNRENSTNNRFSSIPAFTMGLDGKVGMLKRQCTNEYKIEQVDLEIQQLYGLQPYGRRPKTFIYKGISLDEIDRMSIPDAKWKVHVYPFVGYTIYWNDSQRFDTEKMSRTDILNWYKENHLPVPPKSACTFCPYQSDAAWAQMKIEDPEDFAAAVEIDYAIRNSSKKGIKQPIFLHRSLRPLDQIDFDKNPSDLWNGECSGNCHI